MMRHETERLWALAADELELDDRRYVELHLQDCPECRDALEAVRIARGALDAARKSTPPLDWLATDERVGALVERKMRATARPRWMPLAVAGAMVAVAAAVTFVLWPAETPIEPPTEPPLVQLPEPKPIRVEVARGLTRVAATNEPVIAGETLKGGDVLRTSVAGKAFVHLPDSSHLRVAAGTQVALTRVDADDVALTLNRGRLAVRASHEQRKGFVVHAGGVDVHVVGTIFSVANGPAGVEVAVAEGQVKVESERGEAEVKAGQRLSIDPKGRAKLGSINQAVERELSEVQGIAEAVSSVENRPAAVVSAKGGALPRLSPEESKARLASSPVEVSAESRSGSTLDVETSARSKQASTVEQPAPVQAPAEAPVVLAAAPEQTTTKTVEPETEVEVERWDGPGTAFPSLAGGYTRGVPFRREPEPEPKAEGPASEESEWVAPPKTVAPRPLPTPAPVAPAPSPAAIAPPTLIVPVLDAKPTAAPTPAPAPPAPAAKPADLRSRSKSLEQLFFEKAEASLATGGCDRFLTGLEDIAIERQDSAQYARILRARCFDSLLRPRQAMGEYAKYLEAYPNGRFVEEARSALGQ